MKDLFKKSWFISTLIIGIMLIVFLLNLWIVSLNLKAPYDEDTIMSLGANLEAGRYVTIFSFVFRIAFYVSIVPILLSGLSFLKKSNWGFTIALVYFLLFATGLIAFQTSYNVLPMFAIVLNVFNFILAIGIFVLLIFRNKALYETRAQEDDENEKKLSATKIPLSILIIDIVSILVFLTTFFIPLYTLVDTDSTYRAIIIRVLFSGDTNYDVLIYFFVNFIIFLSMFLYFAKCITFYFFDKERFILKSKALINFIFVATIIFFITGLALHMYYTLDNRDVSSSSYIPMLLMCVVIFIYSIFRGKYSAYTQIPFQESKVRYARVESLLYVILITVVSVLMVLLKIIKIEIEYETYSNLIEMTGLTILQDYSELDPGYRLLAFLLVVMLIAVGLTLVTAISSYLSKHKQFNAMVKLAAIVNVFFVFIIAVSGYYFQIAKEINQTVLIETFEYYGISLPSILEYDYTISTDAIYALIASLVVLIVMFIRKSFDREELTLLEASLTPSSDNLESNNGAPGESSPSYTDDETLRVFDPCPAFTDLDSRVSNFQQDLEKRNELKVGETSLNDLVHFIVEYARNSRLHLSYTPEDIATFVAGLGASKLSILQGMSGTGKTSLPKIFSEAVFGNCEIVEVESSWKDKNELLGYYNEFSMKYTPKKFTLALYKAALNKEILTFILLDEMNLSRIEYYFSDFLSLMENEENQREIKLINIRLNRKDEENEIEYLALDQGTTLKVPSNVWFIGTANRDESTFVISDKVYDRAHTMNFTKRAPKVRNYSNPISRQYYDYQTINDLFIEAKRQGTFDAEQNELIKNVEALLSPFNISFGNRILKQIEDFVNVYKACFSNADVENEAIEKILLSKVVAKLEVKTIDDKEKLEMEFEKLNLNQCAAFIKRLDNE
ncbi:MAG: hypothetical protein RBT45_03255 [Acholeplasmataceae bacterium]|nr:hypothetical protein [Acholeplasmataceae bacterium]